MIRSSEYRPWIFFVHFEPVDFEVDGLLRVWWLWDDIYIIFEKKWFDVVDCNFFYLCLEDILSVELDDLVKYLLELCLEVNAHVTIKN